MTEFDFEGWREASLRLNKKDLESQLRSLKRQGSSDDEIRKLEICLAAVNLQLDSPERVKNVNPYDLMEAIFEDIDAVIAYQDYDGGCRETKRRLWKRHMEAFRNVSRVYQRNRK